MKKYSAGRLLVYLGLLTALEIVLSRFASINTFNLKIGFGFVPIVAAAIMFGSISAAVVAGLGDFVGAVAFPVGPYFFGFTLSAAICGIIRGVCLYKKRSVIRSLIAAFVCQMIIGLFLNTFWISVLYGTAFWANFYVRLPQCGALFAVEAVVSYVLQTPLIKLRGVL